MSRLDLIYLLVMVAWITWDHGKGRGVKAGRRDGRHEYRRELLSLAPGAPRRLVDTEKEQECIVVPVQFGRDYKIEVAYMDKLVCAEAPKMVQ